MSNFKTYVLDFALNQINELTDITAKYEQHKKGRTISGFSFTFKQKKGASVKVTHTKNPSYFFSKMTDPQRHLFANKLAELPEMGSYSQGTESYSQFAIRISEMLKDAKKFEELFPYLQKVGFQSA